MGPQVRVHADVVEELAARPGRLAITAAALIHGRWCF